MIQSRQTTRRALWEATKAAVNAQTMTSDGNKSTRYRGMPRAERRKLSKAYFLGAWRRKEANAN